VKDLVTICSDPYEAAHQTHAIIVATEWDEFVVSIISYYTLNSYKPPGMQASIFGACPKHG